jgi:hypothetical protein
MKDNIEFEDQRKNETFSMLSSDKIMLAKLSMKLNKSQGKILAALIRAAVKRLKLDKEIK